MPRYTTSGVHAIEWPDGGGQPRVLKMLRPAGHEAPCGCPICLQIDADGPETDQILEGVTEPCGTEGEGDEVKAEKKLEKLAKQREATLDQLVKSMESAMPGLPEPVRATAAMAIGRWRLERLNRARLGKGLRKGLPDTSAAVAARQRQAAGAVESPTGNPGAGTAADQAVIAAAKLISDAQGRATAAAPLAPNPRGQLEQVRDGTTRALTLDRSGASGGFNQGTALLRNQGLAQLKKALSAAPTAYARQQAAENLTRARLRMLNERLLAGGRLGMR